MKRTAAALALVFTVSLAAGHSAHAELAKPTTLPGSATYGLDQAMESISLALTFGEAKKAKKRLKFAEERLAEAAKLASQNRSQKAGKALRSYSRQMENVEQATSELPGEKQAEISEHINATREKRTAVLEKVMQKVPDQALQGIRTALDIPAPPGKPQQDSQESEDTGFSPGYTATGRVIKTN
ncbi:MAG: DUF5667 domain-containing protein [Candidatus Nanohaloarchaea archaeon]